MLHRLLCATAMALTLPAVALPVAAQAQDQATEQATPEADAPAEAAPELTIPDDLSADTVLATVGDADITLGHLLTARLSLPGQYQQLPANALYEGLLDQLVRQEVLKQAMTGDVPSSVAYTMENSERSMLAGVALTQYLDTAVSDEAVRERFETEFADANAEPSTEWNAAHILVETEDEAAEIVTELEGGEDFAKLARDRSTGPSGPNGGELGWFGEGMMVAPFQAAVETLEPGEISAPIQTQFGWHVIKLMDKREKVVNFEDVEEELRSQMQQEASADYIDELSAGATVDASMSEGFDPAILDRTDLLE